MECTALPKGWIREEVPRLSNNIHGVSGRSDVYYISPTGKKIRSKPELSKALGEHYDLTAFDFVAGKINPLLLKPKSAATASSGSDGNKRKSTPNGNRNSGHEIAKAIRTDSSLVPPIRQTASIFKQPVTVHRSQSSGSKVKTDKQNSAEKPRQLFWEKRLASLRPSYPDDEFQPFSLPDIFKPLGPGIECESALASISTALHMSNGPIVGQTTKKGNDDLASFLNPDQPLISSTIVTQADIDRQEAIVKETRMKLAEAIEALSG
jgi:methyl-CpG-binding domain protein 2